MSQDAMISGTQALLHSTEEQLKLLLALRAVEETLPGGMPESHDPEILNAENTIRKCRARLDSVGAPHVAKSQAK